MHDLLQELVDEGEELDEAMEDEFYMRRLDAGLFTLQLIDCIIMEVCCSGVTSVKNKLFTYVPFVITSFPWQFTTGKNRRIYVKPL